jgi:HSP20 family protein
MAIVRWRPFTDTDRWFDDFLPTPFFDEGRGFTPAIDVYQTKDRVVVETPLAGIDPEKVNVSVENDILTIEGSMEKKSEVDEKEYYRKEIRTGSFHRSVALPVAVNGEKASATFEKGILKVAIPKAEDAKPKTIKVNVVKSN